MVGAGCKVSWLRDGMPATADIQSKQCSKLVRCWCQKCAAVSWHLSNCQPHNQLPPVVSGLVDDSPQLSADTALRALLKRRRAWIEAPASRPACKAAGVEEIGATRHMHQYSHRLTLFVVVPADGGRRAAMCGTQLLFTLWPWTALQHDA
jgi:hypothetical protein